MSPPTRGGEREDLLGDGLRAATGDVEHMGAGELAHPGELAAGVVAGAALEALDVAFEELCEAERPAGGDRRPGGVCASDLILDAVGDHLIDTPVDALVEVLALHGHPDEEGRAAQVMAPQLREALRRRELPHVEQLESPDDPLAIVLPDPLSGPGGAGFEGGVKGGCPVLLKLPEPVLPDPGSRWGCKLEIGESGAQVEAGAADDERPAAGGEQPVDLRVGELGVAPDAEALGDREEGDEPVLEARPLGLGGHPGEDLKTPVDLQGVGGHGDGPLAPREKSIGESEGDIGLADGGRPEEGKDIRRSGLAGDHPEGVSRRPQPTSANAGSGHGLQVRASRRADAARRRPGAGPGTPVMLREEG